MVVVHVVIPAPLRFVVPQLVLALQVTIPEAREAGEPVAATVAVNVTDAFKLEGFVEEVTVTVGVALPTVCENCGLAARALLVSPLYVATIAGVPTGRAVV
jgi:hypothetical protein